MAKYAVVVLEDPEATGEDRMSFPVASIHDNHQEAEDSAASPWREVFALDDAEAEHLDVDESGDALCGNYGLVGNVPDEVWRDDKYVVIETEPQGAKVRRRDQV